MSKICVQCSQPFPSQIQIDGKRHLLKNRTKCLDCVPFKSSKNGTGRLYSKWSEERKARHRAVAAAKGLKRKRELVLAAGGECIKCGYDKCLRALTFHHRNPSEKTFELNSNSIKGKPWAVVLEELAKCDLLCVRCHAEVHDEEYSHYIDTQVHVYENSSKPERAARQRKEYKCEVCGDDKSDGGKLCVPCSRTASRKADRPSLEVLEKQIAELGYCATGRLYGVSDNAIRKWLKNYQAG